MKLLFCINPSDKSIISSMLVNQLPERYNTEEDSAVNEKAYWVEASIIDVDIDAVSEVEDGYIDDYTDGVATRTMQKKLIPIEQRRAKALLTVREVHAAALNAMTQDATTAEQRTYERQSKIVNKHQSGDSNATNALNKLTKPSETADDLAALILEKEQAFEDKLCELGGIKRTAEAAIATSNTPETVAAQAKADLQAALAG